MKARTIIFFMSVAFLYASTILCYGTFLGAYFNGKEIVVSIDSFGEADFELWLFPVLLVVSTISFLVELKYLEQWKKLHTS